MANTSINSKTKRVEDDKTKKQEEDLKAAKAKIEEQNKKALENREKNKQVKKQEVKESSNNDSNVNSEQIINLASKALSGKKKKGFFSGLLIGIIIGLVLGVVLSTTFINASNNAISNVKENADQVLDETLLGYTAVDFKEAILGKSIEKQDLIVMEQPLTTETTITKAGLGNLEIFSKVKTANFAGKGIYTVDLSKMSEDKILVDEDGKTVTIKIPRTTLYEVIADFDNTTFEDTEKGLLAFGDLSLTLEEQNELEKSVQDSMKEELNKKELLDKADDIAKTKVWEIYNPLVVAISDEYITVIDWE